MTKLLPIIEQLAEFQTDNDRAEWLLKAPDNVVLRDYEDIRVVLLQAGFRLGVACLRMRFTALHAVRMQDGDLPPATTELLQRVRSVLLAVVNGEICEAAALQ